MPSPPVFANALGVKSLYHYEKLRADRLSATLRDQKIYCSDRNKLNDPWDCFPTFDTEPLKDPKAFQHAMDWLHSKARAPLRDDLKLELESRIRNDEDYAKQSVSRWPSRLDSEDDCRKTHVLFDAGPMLDIEVVALRRKSFRDLS